MSDAFSCVYNNNNILFLGGSSNNQILVVDTNTADTLLTSAFDRPTGFFPIDDIGTPEMWAVSLTLTTIRRFNLSTGSLIATTAPTGVVTNASASRFVSYDSTKAIAANTVNLYTINPSTFVTSNLTAHGVGGRAFIAINKNAASAQNGTVMFVGDNGVGLFDCTTNTISLAVSTLGGIVDNCHDVIYCPINDYWIVVAVVGGTIRIVYLRPLTATTFTVVNTITTAFIYASISLSNVFTTNQIKIQVDETLDFLFYATTSRLLIYRLSTGQLLNSISLSMLGGGSQQQSLSIDTVNKRLFFCTGGSTSLSITQELIYAP